MEDKLTAQ